MIVIDASIAAPAVLSDEVGWPEWIERALVGDQLIAPTLWPAEVMNFLHMAERRRRIDRPERDLAVEQLRAWNVTIMPYPSNRVWGAVSRLADEHGLTIYDAAYLDLALDQAATLASLDGDLVAAARARGVAVLTY